MKKVYTILDTVAKRIGPLVVFTTHEEAKRAVRHALVGGSDEIMKRSPHDFKLLNLGDIDVSTGVLVPYTGGHVVVCGVETLVEE